MATTDNIYNNFFSTIGSTSAFETVRKVQKLDVNRLTNELQFAKFSDLGTPVIDYVELTLYDDLAQTPQKTNKGLAFSSASVKQTVENIGNSIKQGIAQQVMQHGINKKTLHLNNVEVSANQTNNIVRTSINGADGTFKEFYNTGDLIINLTGSLTGTSQFQDDIQNLNNFSRIYLANQRFDIKSEFINQTFAVFDVVMSDFTLTLNKEYSNVIDYTISLESDTDINIIF